MSRRTDRVADLVRAELSRLILQEMGDPRVELASISAVDVSPDLHHARVSVSVLGEAGRREAVEALQGARGFLRSRLASKLQLKHTPELQFELDRGAEHSQRISQLLESLHVDDEST
ncbi:MAG: 30S ribosome-binding factor RbfA [Acidobacteriota bacterium]|jgi:ribosome-binding factor A